MGQKWPPKRAKKAWDCRTGAKLTMAGKASNWKQAPATQHAGTHIYIYICNLNWWAPKWPTYQKSPNYWVKNGQDKPPQNRGGFSCIFGLFFLQLFVIFPLFLFSLLFHDILKSQNIEMPRRRPIQGTPGNSFWGSRTGILGWLSWADENGQSWYVGHGE